MIKEIFSAVAVVSIFGLVFGYLLAIASGFLSVPKDPLVEKIRDSLPGADCGGCGYAGCEAYAVALAKGDAPCNLCQPGGQKTADVIADLTGRSAGHIVPMKAFVYCSGGGSGKSKYNFAGMKSCIPASRVAGGPHVCVSSCVGFGSCVKVCAFNAISIVNGVALVDYNKCTGCGACVAECPKGIIALTPSDRYVQIPCRSHLKGPEVIKGCELGCIGCKKCEKVCESDAVKVTDFLAEIDYTKCTSCGKCVSVCPRHLIINHTELNPVYTDADNTSVSTDFVPQVVASVVSDIKDTIVTESTLAYNIPAESESALSEMLSGSADPVEITAAVFESIKSSATAKTEISGNTSFIPRKNLTETVEVKTDEITETDNQADESSQSV